MQNVLAGFGQELNQNVRSKTRALEQHTIYLYGDIGAPDSYVDEIETIRNLGEGDSCIIRINSSGGRLDGALALINAIKDAEGYVHAAVDGECMSAATFIFLSAMSWELSDHSQFMIHNASSGMFGKVNDMALQSDFFKQYMQDLYMDVYQGFLSKKEIKRVLKGEDIWLNTKQVGDRLEKLVKVRTEQMEAMFGEDDTE